ncbi:hypothetical protein CW731_00075 [Polaribacter sp. ALD11]|uniref:hypothetical protein n=1 Tax=Polaribacter sp. ALD11 TaxID=2058137 RepID=UPI000C3053B4|nr:hypothetical protein [Polaribacter sp. ALD11]AUC83795.1 hypothetical protein CW731_00075 [Polaribacter sp. ALD11]
MKVNIIYIVLNLFFFIFFASCKGQKEIIDKNNKEILNLILKEYDSVLLIKETYYNDKSLKPANVLNPYYRVYNYKIMDKPLAKKNDNIAYSVFLKDVDGVVSKKELDEIKNKYQFWSIKEWESSNIENNKIKIISIDNIKSYQNHIPIIRLSEPLYSKDKKKAIIYEYYVKNKVGANGIRVIIKKNGNWKIKGGIPNGTVN